MNTGEWLSHMEYLKGLLQRRTCSISQLKRVAPVWHITLIYFRCHVNTTFYEVLQYFSLNTLLLQGVVPWKLFSPATPCHQLTCTVASCGNTFGWCFVFCPQGIGNGIPIGAVVTTPEVAHVLTRRSYFNTFGGNPVCTAGGLAVLRVLEKEKLQENAFVVGSYMKERLRHLQEKHDSKPSSSITSLVRSSTPLVIHRSHTLRPTVSFPFFWVNASIPALFNSGFLLVKQNGEEQALEVVRHFDSDHSYMLIVIRDSSIPINVGIETAKIYSHGHWHEFWFVILTPKAFNSAMKLL